MSTNQKHTSRWKKVLAFFIGWIGSGILWAVGTAVGTTANISTDSTFGMICEIIGIILVIWVWVKLYRHYVEKWATDVIIQNNQQHKENNISPSNQLFCTKCGTSHDVQSKFCKKCGNKLI